MYHVLVVNSSPALICRPWCRQWRGHGPLRDSYLGFPWQHPAGSALPGNNNQAGNAATYAITSQLWQGGRWPGQADDRSSNSSISWEVGGPMTGPSMLCIWRSNHAVLANGWSWCWLLSYGGHFPSDTVQSFDAYRWADGQLCQSLHNGWFSVSSLNRTQCYNATTSHHVFCYAHVFISYATHVVMLIAHRYTHLSDMMQMYANPHCTCYL